MDRESSISFLIETRSQSHTGPLSLFWSWWQGEDSEVLASISQKGPQLNAGTRIESKAQATRTFNDLDFILPD